MSSAEEIIKTIKDYYKHQPIVPEAVEITLGYWCQDASYDGKTNSLEVSLDTKRFGDLESIKIPNSVNLSLTKLKISLYYGEDVGSVIFVTPPRRGGSLVLDVFDIAEDYKNKIKLDLRRICRHLNFKPDPEYLFQIEPKSIEEANEIFKIIEEDVKRIEEKYLKKKDERKSFFRVIKKYFRKMEVEKEDLEILAKCYNEIKNLALSDVVLEDVRNAEPGERKDTVFAKLLYLRSYILDLLIKLCEKN
ncbi:MAG: hypothetical protein QXL86_02405 [Candidatus Aenigmatarchaeota archaeon]